MRGRVIEFSLHKFSSNVIEKCLEFGSPAECALLVDEVLAPTLSVIHSLAASTHPHAHKMQLPADGSTPLQSLLHDPFGNYVAQKLLDVGNDAQRAAMTQLLVAYTPQLQRSPYGKHILARLEKMLLSSTTPFVPQMGGEMIMRGSRGGPVWPRGGSAAALRRGSGAR